MLPDRAGRRRRLTVLAASAASVAGAIVLAVAVVLPLTAAPGPASPPEPPAQVVSITLSPVTPASTGVLAVPLTSWASAPHICTCRPPRPRSPDRTSY